MQTRQKEEEKVKERIERCGLVKGTDKAFVNTPQIFDIDNVKP